MQQYIDYILEQARALLAIDSPSGFTKEVSDYVVKEYRNLGYEAKKNEERLCHCSYSGKRCERWTYVYGAY